VFAVHGAANSYDTTVQFMELREQREMTQAQLANATGINQGEINRIERGSATRPRRRSGGSSAHSTPKSVSLRGRPAQASYGDATANGRGAGSSIGSNGLRERDRSAAFG
jgi:Helix-turn-helix